MGFEYLSLQLHVLGENETGSVRVLNSPGFVAHGDEI
jgi:hypothetical protein